MKITEAFGYDIGLFHLETQWRMSSFTSAEVFESEADRGMKFRLQFEISPD